MREIKFRAYEKVTKRMIYFEKPFVTMSLERTTFEICIKSNHENMAGQPSQELMQFTGLKDKNGKEIYEGDVVKDRFGNHCEVIYDDGQWWAKNAIEHLKRSISAGTIGWNEYEIIGNIYSNPELLNTPKRGE